MTAPSFTCPRCGAISYHPMDVHEGYCGACHDWTAPQPGWRLHHYDRDGQPMPMREWSERFGELAYKHVRATAVNEDVEVSTVWIDLPQAGSTPERPLIFETMVFGGELDEWAWRYATEEEAEAGHEQVLAEVRERINAR